MRGAWPPMETRPRPANKLWGGRRARQPGCPYGSGRNCGLYPHLLCCHHVQPDWLEHLSVLTTFTGLTFLSVEP